MKTYASLKELLVWALDLILLIGNWVLHTFLMRKP